MYINIVASCIRTADPDMALSGNMDSRHQHGPQVAAQATHISMVLGSNTDHGH